MHRLTRKQARRIAVRAQLLDSPRPDDLLTVVQRLTFLQIDPTAAVAPSADLQSSDEFARLARSQLRQSPFERTHDAEDHDLALVRHRGRGGRGVLHVRLS